MAKVRKRKWTSPKGEEKVAYVVDYKDASGTRRTPQFEKKKEADAYLDKVKRELFEGSHMAVSETWNFDVLARSYLDDCERRHRIGDDMSGNTLVSNRWAVERHLISYFGSKKASLINGVDVQQLVNAKAERFKRVSVGKMLDQLRMVLRHGVRIGRLRRNVVIDSRPRLFAEEKRQIELPTIAALRDMVQAIEEAIASPEFKLSGQRRQKHDGLYNSALVAYLAMTAGYRTGEICGLHWEDVDFVEGQIRISKSLSRYDGLKGTKSVAGRRTVPIVPLLRRHLEAAWKRQGQPQTGFVIKNSKGGHVPSRELSPVYWQPIARSLNLTREDKRLLNLHGLRHVAASLWIRGGVPDLALKALIGHSSIAFTKDVYGHLFPEDANARTAMIASMGALVHAPEHRLALGSA